MTDARSASDVLIYGGGAAGVCAGVQAARMGARVTIVEPTLWLGGMVTAAGVTALDGNKGALGGGLVHHFREALQAHYGPDQTLFTGWVSETCFEPPVGARIFREWAEAEPRLTVRYQTEVTGYERTGRGVRRVTTRSAEGAEATVDCRVFVDASEYGDGLKLAGLPYRLGRESRAELGEDAAPERPDDHLQDLTYVATLRRDPDAPPAPPPTDEERAAFAAFRCSTADDCDHPDEGWLGHGLHAWDSFLGYGLLPNDRFMLNWPFRSNDYPATVRFFEDPWYRQAHLRAAKQHTLRYVRYMQTVLGHPEWVLDHAAYPTRDGLPLLPYVRESRRLQNGCVMTMQAVVPEGAHLRAPVIADSIAVGDYFLDHHHAAAHAPPGVRLVEDYPANAPFQVPISVFLTDDDPCFLAAEKNVAVSHIVNGCTRLQPVVMLMGQAVGALAALAAQRERAPAEVPVRDVQHALIASGAQLFPVYDVGAGHPAFAAVQQLALAGLFDATTALRLEPDAPLSPGDARRWAERAGRDTPPEAATRGAFFQALAADLPA